MMQIRNNVFETNSSSTHSICISKKPATIGNHVSFHLGEYGWEEDEVDIRDYLYTAIMCMDDSDELLDELKGILDSNGITYDFEKPRYSEDDWRFAEFGINHSYDTRDFVEAVLNDEDMLMRLLFNADSVVYTGNDNDSDEDSMCFVAYRDEWRYDKDKNDWVKIDNPVYNHPDADQDNFDYFYKGN